MPHWPGIPWMRRLRIRKNLFLQSRTGYFFYAVNKDKKIFVLSEAENQLNKSLSEELNFPLLTQQEINQAKDAFFLSWQEGRLTLFDTNAPRKGVNVEFDARCTEQNSWPAPKKGPLAQAMGRKTQTVIDATAGWGQDCFHIFRMGYQVSAIERSPVMAALLQDGFSRLERQSWMQQLQLNSPELIIGNAIEVLNTLAYHPDCIYLDPMFPSKRKKSALAKKPMVLLRGIAGDDEDRQKLFDCAWQAAEKRVVVKSPDYAESLGGKPDESFAGKLVRYDVYLK